MSENQAAQAFVVLHLPLFFALLLAAQPSAGWARAAISLFLVIHAVLHWCLKDRSECNFTSTLSLLLIYGAAGIGVLHLMVLNLIP